MLGFHRRRIKLIVIEASLVEPYAHTRLDDGLKAVGCVDGTKQALVGVQIWCPRKRSLLVLAQTLHHVHRLEDRSHRTKDCIGVIHRLKDQGLCVHDCEWPRV